MSALVSVIIPVYNLEEYIEHCIRSILNQTYKNVEVICVDDGSKDSSAEVISGLCKTDERIRYIYQENAGVSAARNNGLELATGDYIVFVDGDDYMHYQTIEIFVNAIKNSGFDCVCAPEIKTADNDENMEEITEYKCEKINHEDLFSYKYGSVLGKSVWSKIFRNDVAKSVRFKEEFSNGEDANYIVRILANGATIGIVDKNLYYYFQRENSYVTSDFTESKFSITLSFDDLCEFLKDSEYSFLKAYCLQYLYQSIFYNRTSSIGTPAQKYVLRESKRIGEKWLDDFKNNNDIDANIKKLFVPFFRSRHLYEIARMVKDPTMFVFYVKRPFKRFKKKD